MHPQSKPRVLMPGIEPKAATTGPPAPAKLTNKRSEEPTDEPHNCLLATAFEIAQLLNQGPTK